MTVKIQSMTLPTGEYLIVITGKEIEGYTPTERESEEFRIACGAVGVLAIAVDDVEVVDAPYNEDAKRVEPKPMNVGTMNKAPQGNW